MTWKCLAWNVGGLRNLLTVPLTFLWAQTFAILFFGETQEAVETTQIENYSRFSNPAIPSTSGHALGGVSFFISKPIFGTSVVEQLVSPWEWVLPLTILLPSTQATILLVGVYAPRLASFM